MKPTKSQKAQALDSVTKTRGSDSRLSEMALQDELREQYETSFDALETIRDTWEAKESMLVGKNIDSISNTTKSQVNDNRLATIIMERAARVMAQLPTGKVKALSIKDTGKNTFMNLVREKYILPNAGSQFDLLTEERLWDVYSNVYGSMGKIVDYVITDEYIGPRSKLIPVRSLIPQKGAISIKDSSYVFIESEYTVDWLEKRNPKFWKNLDEIIKKAKEGGKDPASKEAKKRTFNENRNNPIVGADSGPYAKVTLVTRYEKDRWVTFAPDYDFTVVRDIDNPQKNHRIPIVIKHAFPLIDSFFGLGEFERGKTLQFAINSLINLYLDGVKMSIFPPIMVDPSGVIPSSIRFNPAQKWLITKPNAITPFPANPQGMQTFQTTYQFLIAALMNMAGTTDTTISSGQDFAQGKTPEALKQIKARESARDNWDRFMMEKAVEEEMDLMVDMLAQKQEKPIELELFSEDIKQIQKNSPDLSDMLEVSESGEYAKLSVKQKDIGNSRYKFFIDAGSSQKQDDQEAHQIATEFLAVTLKAPQIIQLMTQGETKKTIDYGQLMDTWIKTSGLPNADKIVIDLPQNPTPDQLGQQVDPNQPLQSEQAIQAIQQQSQAVPPQMQGMMAQGQPQPQMMQRPQFQNPEIQAMAESIMGGQG